ncbi:MAG: hypothetical protein LBS23_03010, partial [Holosporaceae bacterium]|nr:hypothetical protein [Holosporaceae bacterium]
MFQKIFAAIFCIVFSLNSFCMKSSSANMSFADHVRAANFYVNVLGESNGVRLSIINDGIGIFNRRLSAAEYGSLPDLNENDISLCKQNDDVLCQIYSASRGVFFSFLFNLNGDIELSSGGAKETGMAQNTKFAFQTNKSIKNHNPIAFHHLAISCDDFYNYSVLQMNDYALFAKYYYNGGVIDSQGGRANVPLGLKNYVGMGFITQKPAGPSRKSGIFDNFGAFLGRDVHALGNLSVNSTGFLNTENLFVQNGNISAGQLFDISGSLSGKIDSFRVAPQTFAHVGNMQVDPMKNLLNQGNLHISKSSKLDVESLENDGEITGSQSLDILVDTLKNDKGIILAKEAMNLIKRSKEGIKQQIRAEEEAKIEFGKLLGSKVKVQHHTDYYLNTITDHYTRDQFGRETFSHRTETGYVFQRRETKTEEKELPAEVRQHIAEALKAKDKQLEFLRLSLRLLDKMEEVLKAQIDAAVAENDSADDAIVDIHALRSVLKADDPESLDHFLLTPRVYDAISSHNVAFHSLLSFLNGKGDINKVFAEQRTAPV